MNENIITKIARMTFVVISYCIIIALAIMSVPIIILINIITGTFNKSRVREMFANIIDDFVKILDLVEVTFDKIEKLLKI